jgi:hypothetical protein
MGMVCNRSIYSLSKLCLALVYTVYGNGKQRLYATAYGNGTQPLMETERDCLGNRLWKRKGAVWATTRQPLMETEGGCLGNRLWKRKGAVWATAYGNGRGLFGKRL